MQSGTEATSLSSKEPKQMAESERQLIFIEDSLKSITQSVSILRGKNNDLIGVTPQSEGPDVGTGEESPYSYVTLVDQKLRYLRTIANELEEEVRRLGTFI